MNEALSRLDDRREPTTAPSIPEPTADEIAPDETAKQEATEVASGNYDENENKRNDQLRWHVHIAMLCGVWLVTGLVCVAIFAVAFDYLTPWGWLADSQLTAVKTFLFSGAVTGIGGRYVSSRITGLSR